MEWEGRVQSPDVEKLSADSANNLGEKTGRLVGYPWRCTQCGRLLNPSVNYLANLQPFNCIICGIENKTSYFWSMTKCYLNGVNLNGKIYHQKKDECVLYALFALCDFARRVRGARQGFIESTAFSPVVMRKYFQEVNGYRLADGPSEGQDYDVIENILKTTYLGGVPYETTIYHRLRSSPNKTAQRHLKIKSWFRIPSSSIEEITRLLANGIPLIGSIIDGNLFPFVNAHDIYLAPISYEAGHAVVLHGSGLAVGNRGSRDMQGSPLYTERADGKHGTYYNCRNSHGNEAHPCYEQKGSGGDFNVWASDLLGCVYGLNLADDDDDYYYYLLAMEGSSRNSAPAKPNHPIKTLRVKPFTMTLEEIKDSIGIIAQIVREKVYEEMGTKILDLEFPSHEEAQFVMDNKDAYKGRYNIVWAPYNLSALRRDAGAKVEYQETERDTDRTGEEDGSEDDFTEDKDY